MIPHRLAKPRHKHIRRSFWRALSPSSIVVLLKRVHADELLEVERLACHASGHEVFALRFGLKSEDAACPRISPTGRRFHDRRFLREGRWQIISWPARDVRIGSRRPSHQGRCSWVPRLRGDEIAASLAPMPFAGMSGPRVDICGRCAQF